MNPSESSQPASTGALQLPLEVSVQAAARLLREDPRPAVLDVREFAERQFCRLPDDFHIPTGQIQSAWTALPRDRHLLVYCHHGMRSLRVASFLRTMGFTRVQSIAGGTEAWSLEIDPALPRY